MKNPLTNKTLQIILAATIAGFLFVGRYLTMWWYQLQQGEPFNFFTFQQIDPLSNLAPIFRQVMDGGLYVTDGRVLEWVAGPSLWSMLSPVVGYPIVALTKNMSVAFLLGTIISAALVFVAAYAIAKHLTKSHWWALISSFVFVNATLIVLFILPVDMEGLRVLARSFWLGSPPGDIVMSRYVSFSVFPTWPVFVFSLLGLLKLASNPTSKKWFWLTALAMAALTHMYVTDAMYIFAGVAVMVVWYFLQTDTHRAKTFFKLVLLATLLSAPYITNYLSIQALPHAQELVERLGAEFTHSFRFSAWPQYLLMLILAYGVWKWGKAEKRIPDATVIASLVLSGIGILNMQIILGFNPHPPVWPVHQFYLGYAAAFLVIAHLFITHSLKTAWLKKAGSVVLVIASLLIITRGVQAEFISGTHFQESSIMPEHVRNSLEWVDENIPTNSVVASPSATTNSLIPVYTGAHSIQPLAVTSAAPLSEVVGRWLTISKLYGIPEATLMTSLKKEHKNIDSFALDSENATAIFLFDTYFWKKGLGAFDEGRQLFIPDEAIEKILSQYQTLPEDEKLLEPYRMDYLYVGPYERALGMKELDYEFLEQVYDEQDIQIYKINQGGFKL